MKNDNSDKQMVGAQIPDRLFQLINLHSFSKESSKSQILRDAILLWIDHNGIHIDNLITEVIKMYQARWLRVKDSDRNISFSDFLNEVRLELKEQRVNKQIIDEIVNYI